SRIREGAADATTFLRRPIAQGIVHESRGLIRIHLVKIANRFFSHFSRRIIEQLCCLFKRTIRKPQAWSDIPALRQLLCSVSQSGDVSTPPLIFPATCRRF